MRGMREGCLYARGLSVREYVSERQYVCASERTQACVRKFVEATRGGAGAPSKDTWRPARTAEQRM
eukprot:6148620-Pleurochrysis_carterae.AAC.1